MKIFAFSGLGADERVFQFLNLKHELIPVNWITPKKNESIEEYSKRLALSIQIDNEDQFMLLGVSFGGLIATEISKIYPPQKTILISSIETKDELSSFKKALGKIIKVLPIEIIKPPLPIINHYFGAKNKKLLKEIINDTDKKFTKWALNELLNWKNNKKLINSLIISGSEDKLLPTKNKKAIIIEKGTHFMIVDQANEISTTINNSIES